MQDQNMRTHIKEEQVFVNILRNIHNWGAWVEFFTLKISVEYTHKFSHTGEYFLLTAYINISPLS